MVKYEIIRSRPGTIIDVYTLEFTGSGDVPFETAEMLVEQLRNQDLNDIEDLCSNALGVKYEMVRSAYLPGENSSTFRQVYSQ